MTEPNSSNSSWLRSIGIGVGVSIVTAVIMASMMKMGISPMPKPLGLAFAEAILGTTLMLPVGLAFHTIYVTFWSVLYVRFFPKRNVKTALLLALVLWILVLAVFFPVVGWGFAGSAVSVKLIPASLMPHILFALLLWGLDKFIKSTP